MGAKAKVSNGLSSVTGTSEHQSVLTSRSTTSQLVDGEALTTGLNDAGSSSGSESQGGDGGLGDLKNTVVVSNSANHDNSLVGITLKSKGLGDARKRHRRSVDLGKEQLLKNRLVELGLGSASKESVELDQKKEVHVLRLGSGTVALALVLLGEMIFTHGFVV